MGAQGSRSERLSNLFGYVAAGHLGSEVGQVGIVGTVHADPPAQGLCCIDDRQMRERFAYERADILRLAAAYAYALTQNHPFADGNKRVALTVAGAF